MHLGASFGGGWTTDGAAAFHIPHAQKHVQARAERHKQHAQDPGADRVGDLAAVGVADGDAHLLVGRVVAEERVRLGHFLGVAAGERIADGGELLGRQVGVVLVVLLKVAQVVAGSCS